MVPVFLAVALLNLTPAMDYISGIFEPLMVHFGLPGKSALAYVTGSIVNIYAALAITAGLELTSRQITILAIMLGISHSQIMESAIVTRMRARPVVVTITRVIFSLVSGLCLNMMMPE